MMILIFCEFDSSVLWDRKTRPTPKHNFRGWETTRLRQVSEGICGEEKVSGTVSVDLN